MNAPCGYLMATSLGEEYGSGFEAFSDEFYLLAVSVFVLRSESKQRHPIVTMETHTEQHSAHSEAYEC